MMPKLQALLIILIASSVYAEDLAQTQADMFVGYYLARYDSAEHPIAEEQKDALRAAHPLLVPIATDREFRDFFWLNVRGEKRDIDWDAAAQMIRRGEIRQVSQNHDLTVALVTYDGALLKSKAPTISDSYKVISEVDTSHVFILYSTE